MFCMFRPGDYRIRQKDTNAIFSNKEIFSQINKLQEKAQGNVTADEL